MWLHGSDIPKLAGKIMKIILARHGETKWNIEEVFRGRVDVELNETGIKQAGLLAKYLSDFKIDAVYSSPLKRALKTAEIVAGYHKLRVGIAPGLIDLDFGKWQGLCLKDVRDNYKELYTEWVNHPERVKMPDGESLNDVRERAITVIDDVIAKYKETAVLVSHRVVNKVLICALLGLDNSHFWNIKQDTCGTSTFIYENGRFILVEQNNTSFMKPLRQAPLSDF